MKTDEILRMVQDAADKATGPQPKAKPRTAPPPSLPVVTVVNESENQFLEEIEAATHDGRDTSKLKPHEVVRIERIWDVYFA